jgi:NitT/TauT family transport system ATP-binding protein
MSFISPIIDAVKYSQHKPEPHPEALPAQVGKPGALLSVRSVTKRFLTNRHDTTALHDVSFDVDQGEFICMVGPSGCGKSTLLNLMAGLDFPTSGDLVLDGKKIEGPGADRVVVFQEPALFPWLNVRANVEFGLKMKGTPSGERRDAVDHYLELVNLTRFEKAFAHELSGGMKQRVQLARALAVEPRVLLMDEPFAALDAQTRDGLQQELQEIWARTGATILFITHNVREAALLGDRVFVMTPGPGRIKAELPVSLQRPRDPDTHAVVDYAVEIRTALQDAERDTRTASSAYAI